MGDRALVQFKNADEVSPVVYLHWSGEDVSRLLQQTRNLMGGRETDLSYVTARFIGVCHDDVPGNLSLGVWCRARKLSVKDSPGDAGCFVVCIDESTWVARAVGGYGFGGGEMVKEFRYELVLT